MQETVDNSRQWCYGCGEKNEEGLRITFRLEEGRAVGSFVPRTLHQGYPGLAHGGIAASGPRRGDGLGDVREWHLGYDS